MKQVEKVIGKNQIPIQEISLKSVSDHHNLYCLAMWLCPSEQPFPPIKNIDTP